MREVPHSDPTALSYLGHEPRSVILSKHSAPEEPAVSGEKPAKQWIWYLLYEAAESGQMAPANSLIGGLSMPLPWMPFCSGAIKEFVSMNSRLKPMGE